MSERTTTDPLVQALLLLMKNPLLASLSGLHIGPRFLSRNTEAAISVVISVDKNEKQERDSLTGESSTGACLTRNGDDSC